MNENSYYKIYTWENIVLAWRKARKHKTKKPDIIQFEENLVENLREIQFELMTLTYKPKKLETFIHRDPKTRKISKADFRDRIVHHALCNIISPIFEKSFIYDSCANQKGKGNLFAIKRFDEFKRKVSKNNTLSCFVLKADIKHYFEEVNHSILLKIIERKVSDVSIIKLIKRILENGGKDGRTMPLGNLTSQFFANIYLDKFDKFLKHQLKINFYIRYVDDFVILHNSEEQLIKWKNEIIIFLKDNLTLELHCQKTKIVSLSQGVDFVGFRNFYHFRLVRRRNIRKIKEKLLDFQRGIIKQEEFLEIFNGWNAHAKWANSWNIKKNLASYLNANIESS